MRYCLAGSTIALMLFCGIVSESVANAIEPIVAQITVGDIRAAADLLIKQGNQQRKAGNYQSALWSYQTALATYQAILDYEGEAAAQMGLGNTYGSLSQHQEAISYYNQALLTYRQIPDSIGEAQALGNLGSTYDFLQRYEEAIIYKTQALAIFRQNKNYAGEAKTLTGLANTYKALSDYSRAISLFEQALLLSRKSPDRDDEAGVLNNLGNAYSSLADYSKAILYYERALPLYQQSQDHIGEAGALRNLGNVYSALSDYGKALSRYKQALDIYQKTQNRVDEAMTLMAVGNAYSSLSRQDVAIIYLKQALAVFQQIPDRLGKAAALNNLGTVYESLLEHRTAISHYKQALSIFQQAHSRYGEAVTLTNLGNAKASLMEYDKAIEYYQQALPIFREVQDRDGEAKTLNNLGYLFKTQKQQELAISFYKQSVNIYESIRGELKTLPKDQQQSYTNSVSSAYRTLADLLLSRGDILGAQQTLELLKIQELQEFDQTTRAKITSTSKVELDSAEQQIIDKHGSYIAFAEKLRNCESKKPVCAEYDELNKLWKDNELEYDRAVASLKSAIDERKKQDEQNILDPKNDLSRRAAEIIQDNKTALVYAFVTEDRLWLILATQKEVLRKFEVTVDRATLSKEVLTFRQLMATCESRPCTSADTEALKAASQKLYARLMPPPLQKEIKGKVEHLVFSLDRNLRYIPMSALYDGKRYLIEDYAISTIASAKFNSTEAFKNQSVNVLAAGFSETLPPKFPRPLDNVPIELKAIVKPNPQDSIGIYPGTILLNPAFTFDSLQENLPGSDILHLATHGEFVSKSQTASYILSGDKKEITISQIENLRGIGNLQLVVLSACQTALGTSGQDGVELNSIGISFLSKGAKSVLASLWDVNDISTSLLMQDFYQNLSSGSTSRAQALRRTQLKFLNGDITPANGNSIRASMQQNLPSVPPANSDFKHPYYWSPFVLIGSGF